MFHNYSFIIRFAIISIVIVLTIRETSSKTFDCSVSDIGVIAASCYSDEDGYQLCEYTSSHVLESTVLANQGYTITRDPCVIKIEIIKCTAANNALVTFSRTNQSC
jgi:hypothetical protein